MNHRLWVGIVILGACAGLAAGWLIEHRRIQKIRVGPPSPPIDAAQSALDCDHAPEHRWQTIRTFNYSPVKTDYIVDWQFCSGDIGGQRVRVTDANFQKVFYRYDDDEILRVENVELLNSHIPQLLIVTGSAGTDDREDWHILNEVNGQLREWTWPDYNSPAERLLRYDEDSCCKEWNFHLSGHDIILAEAIYHKDYDGNCCPSRGGVLARLEPVQNGLRLASVQRISRREYYHWRSQPFCFQCTLNGP